MTPLSRASVPALPSLGLLAVLLAACPGVDPAPSEPLLPPEVAFCQEFARQFCARSLSCQFSLPERNEVCLTHIEQTCLNEQARLPPGEWSLVPEQAQTCFADLQTTPCHAPVADCYERLWFQFPRHGLQVACGYNTGQPWLPPSCSPYKIERPRSEPDAFCDSRTGCTEGYTCSTERAGNGGIACGTCEANPAPPPPPVPAPDGSPCETHSGCVSGYCDVDSPRTCRPYTALGQRCDSLAECGPKAYCKGYGLWPSSSPGTVGSEREGTCTPRIPDGGACADEQWDDGCVAGRHHCLDGTCRQVERYSRRLGEECDVPGQCANHLTCSSVPETPTRGECVPFEPLYKLFEEVAPPGQACAPGCVGGYCAEGTCQPWKPNGEACAADKECRSNHCEPETGTCAAFTCP